MTQPPDMTGIFDRIADHRETRSDLDQLRRLGVQGNRNAVTVGHHNISLQGAREIRIDNRVYHGGDVDAIRAVLASLPAQNGAGALRGVGGAVSTIGILTTLVGMGMFFYGLISTMSQGAASPLSDGPPAIVLQGFAVAACGVGIAMVGGIITGWSRRGRH